MARKLPRKGAFDPRDREAAPGPGVEQGDSSALSVNNYYSHICAEAPLWMERATSLENEMILVSLGNGIQSDTSVSEILRIQLEESDSTYSVLICVRISCGCQVTEADEANVVVIGEESDLISLCSN